MIQKANNQKFGRFKMIKCHLSRLLGERKMHITDLQRMTGVRYQTLWNLYQENTQSISYRIADKVCDALGCQLSDLFTREPEN